MLFSVEFDTFFHWECLKQIIDATPDDWYDPEAEIIAREFGLRQ